MSRFRITQVSNDNEVTTMVDGGDFGGIQAAHINGPIVINSSDDQDGPEIYIDGRRVR
ncbi:hypothetical protein [Kutzneria buriramensis]|uniref:Uncharacterized protein n=1 Tax=Kutzneria buriramensis TaxID=1045776 RepID=A0A3E0GU83_9PSEU|nr:hypothetical protein [Kutzneria buriramensis]REH25991.1 hypothetical protein BCF44_13530 [Kutzneria buriramensis]